MILTPLALLFALTPPPSWWEKAELAPLFPPLQAGSETPGWTPLGGSGQYKWEVDPSVNEEGVAGLGLLLHGHGPTARNTFLSSEKKYGDFLLEVDVKIDRGNSGIQIRSHWSPQERRYFGYQIEIDPSSRQWSAGLYDEGRRGWLDSLADNPLARKAFVVGEWNTFRILCVGPRIQTWVNGVAAADHLDFYDLSGHFAFQVHSGSCDVSWRNARLADFGIRTWEPILKAPVVLDGEPFVFDVKQALASQAATLQIEAILSEGLLEISLANKENDGSNMYALQVPAPFHGKTTGEPGVISIVCESTKTTILLNGIPLESGAPSLVAPLAVSLKSSRGTQGTLRGIRYLPPTEQERSLQEHSPDPESPSSP